MIAVCKAYINYFRFRFGLKTNRIASQSGTTYMLQQDIAFKVSIWLFM